MAKLYIDGYQLLELLSEQLVKESGAFSKGVNKGLNISRSLIRNPDAVKPIDPETLPIVRQLREELALITHQRDVYKSVFERITAHGDCNDCEDVKGCRFAPGIGEDTRYNCPLWRGPNKEE